MLIVIGWLYSVGSRANKSLPLSLKKNPIIYNVGFGIAIFNEVLTVIYGFPPVGESNDPQNPIPWFTPLHYASILGMFYGLWFTAKQYVTLQREQSAKFPDYIGPFFLFWISPVGVWFLQPGINDIFSDKRHNNSLNSDAELTQEKWTPKANQRRVSKWQR